MALTTLFVVCVSVLLGSSLGCSRCFVNRDDFPMMCQKHRHDVGLCERRVDQFFTHNQRVIEAGKVGWGYHRRLGDILRREILPIATDFKDNFRGVAELDRRLQTAAENFITAASKLPRKTGCVPPCGYQNPTAEYSCARCRYQSCGFPLDCPVESLQVMKNHMAELWCDAPFSIRGEVVRIWSFAAKVNTTNLASFEEVTAGEDRLFHFPSVGQEHEGTYRCQVVGEDGPVVSLYFYLTVTLSSREAYLQEARELQELYEQIVLTGGDVTTTGSSDLPPSPLLVTACLSALFFLFLLSLWALYLTVRPPQARIKYYRVLRPAEHDPV
ncbi:sperm acrosome membrane-associated protein 6-like [Thalassophryne amazonica]|uniref:sperm acrosome membrane-associated protein 6-like n=1 Tax=Thalassophryne amazonica TaxID=390379 RepID=UPI0014710202|nr:sperm acrosome membrane-associated protein 6-like [Thalassophryne amazonica]